MREATARNHKRRSSVLIVAQDLLYSRNEIAANAGFNMSAAKKK